jgi:hypothetical protein
MTSPRWPRNCHGRQCSRKREPRWTPHPTCRAARKTLYIFYHMAGTGGKPRIKKSDRSGSEKCCKPHANGRPWPTTNTDVLCSAKRTARRRQCIAVHQRCLSCTRSVATAPQRGGRLRGRDRIGRLVSSMRGWGRARSFLGREAACHDVEHRLARSARMKGRPCWRWGALAPTLDPSPPFAIIR